jgi:lipopolysaccharide export system permease protein
MDFEELYFNELYRLGYGGGAASREAAARSAGALPFPDRRNPDDGDAADAGRGACVPPKRSTSALGIFIGIVMVVAYHKVNQYAAAAGAQGESTRSSPCGSLSCCSRR